METKNRIKSSNGRFFRDREPILTLLQQGDGILNFLPAPVWGVFRKAAFERSRAKMRRFFSQFISENDLVFDIGANIGHYSKVFLDIGARIVALDPQPACVEILNQEFAANPDVTVLACGVGSKNETRPFHICRQNHATSTFSNHFMRNSRFSHRKWEQAVPMPVVTLDWLIYIYGRPEFIKIDTEGYELEVIRGLTTRVPSLSFEFSSEFPELTTAAIQHLDDLGRAEFNYSTHGGFTFALHSWVDARRLKQALFQKRNLYAGGDIYCRMR